MGCPQSKQKDISADGGDVTKPQERKLRNDAIKPEAEKQKHVPTKTPHEYNNDALVKGRCDDVAPDVNVTEVISKESNTTKEEKSNISEVKEEKENVEPKKLNETKEKDETGTKKAEESNSETKQPIVIKNNNEISDIKFNSVFVVDENPPTDLQDDKPDDAIDVNDVNISPTINEITLDNQVGIHHLLSRIYRRKHTMSFSCLPALKSGRNFWLEAIESKYQLSLFLKL